MANVTGWLTESKILIALLAVLGCYVALKLTDNDAGVLDEATLILVGALAGISVPRRGA